MQYVIVLLKEVRISTPWINNPLHVCVCAVWYNCYISCTVPANHNCSLVLGCYPSIGMIG